MSHDQEHNRLNALVKALAFATGFAFAECPAAADEDGMLLCERGLVDFGRGARECPVCGGAGLIVTTKDGYCACPDEGWKPLDVKGERRCAKCRRKVDPR